MQVSYSVRLEDGTLVDEREGITINPDDEVMIPALAQLFGEVASGEVRSLLAEPADGFGVYSEELLLQLSASEFPALSAVANGQKVEVDFGGAALRGRVTARADDTITLDLNHPLAGKRLRIEVQRHA